MQNVLWRAPKVLDKDLRCESLIFAFALIEPLKVLLIEGKLPSLDFSSTCLNSSSGDLLLTKIFFEFGVPSAAFGLAERFDAFDGTNEFCKSEVPERSIEVTCAWLTLLLVPETSVPRGEC